MTDDAYLSACNALGSLKDTELSKAMAAVVTEARRRALEAMESADIQELPRLQAHAQQLRLVLNVLQGTARTMTI